MMACVAMLSQMIQGELYFFSHVLLSFFQRVKIRILKLTMMNGLQTWPNERLVICLNLSSTFGRGTRNAGRSREQN